MFLFIQIKVEKPTLILGRKYWEERRPLWIGSTLSKENYIRQSVNAAMQQLHDSDCTKAPACVPRVVISASVIRLVRIVVTTLINAGLTASMVIVAAGPLSQ